MNFCDGSQISADRSALFLNGLFLIQQPLKPNTSSITMSMGHGRNMIMPINNSIYQCVCLLLCSFMCATVFLCAIFSNPYSDCNTLLLNLSGFRDLWKFIIQVFPLRVLCVPLMLSLPRGCH